MRKLLLIGAVFFLLGMSAQSQQNMREEKVSVAKSVSYAIRDGKIAEQGPQLLSKDFKMDGAAGLSMNRDEYIGYFAALKLAFPKMEMNFTHVFVEGDWVCMRYTNEAVHEGEYFGIPATNKKIYIKGIIMRKVVDGKVLEEWECTDVFSIMGQLGVIPEN